MALATLGMLLPNAGMALAASPISCVKDVALQQGGALRGQVISAQGVVQPRLRVSLLRDGQPVAEVLTDKQGRFAVTGLTGGVYLVSTQGTMEVLRAWTHQTAPPAAVTGLLLVPHGDVANGQHDGHRDGDGDGIGLHEMGFGALIIGAIVTTVVVLASNDAS